MDNSNLTKKVIERKFKTAPLAPPPESSVIYEAVTGLNYGCTKDDPHGTRVEVGDEVPASVLDVSPWLLTDGHVRIRKGAQPK